jgi:hypothetical protein
MSRIQVPRTCLVLRSEPVAFSLQPLRRCFRQLRLLQLESPPLVDHSFKFKSTRRFHPTDCPLSDGGSRRPRRAGCPLSATREEGTCWPPTGGAHFTYPALTLCVLFPFPFDFLSVASPIRQQHGDSLLFHKWSVMKRLPMPRKSCLLTVS